MKTVPIIDLGPYYTGGPDGKMTVAKQIDEACRNIGFLVIKNHQVPKSLVEKMRAVSLAYFDLPLEEKMKLKMGNTVFSGYTPMAGTKLSATLGDAEAQPDLKESLSVCPIDPPQDDYHKGPQAKHFFSENVWPEHPVELRPIFTEYYAEMTRLATDMMRMFAFGLGLDENWFDDKIDKHITNMVVLHYPEQDTPPLPGQLRAGEHTDFGSITILARDAAKGGLQARNVDGEWVDVPDIEDTFVINLGDLMAEWTNDRWRSTLHRVLNPRVDQKAQSRRLSVAFFHQPNYDAMIECLPGCSGPGNPPKYSGTTSGDHITMKIAQMRNDFDDKETAATA